MADAMLREIADMTLETYLDEVARGASSVDDIIAVLEGLGHLEFDGETGEPVFVEVDGFAAPPEGHPGPAEPTTTRKPLRSIMERVEGDVAEGMRLAEWALQKRREALEWQEASDQVAEARIAAIREHQASVRKHTERKTGFMDYLLLNFRREAFPGQEGTIKLEGGELRRDKNRDLLEWDEDAAVQWAVHQEAPEVLLSPKKQAIKDRVKDYGEVVGFVRKVAPAEPYREYVKQ